MVDAGRPILLLYQLSQHQSQTSHTYTMDPFYDVYQDGQDQLQLLKTTSTNSLDFNNIKSELVEIINDLETAIEVIRQSKLRATSGNGSDSFPQIDQNEIHKREDLLINFKSSFIDILKDNNQQNPFSSIPGVVGNYSDNKTQEQVNSERQFNDEYNQQLLQQQDELISGELHQTIQNLHNQAVDIGNELDQHNELLTEVEDRIDRLNFKIVNNGIKRINKFLATNERGGNWCIALLIGVLIFILILLVIL